FMMPWMPRSGRAAFGSRKPRIAGRRTGRPIWVRPSRHRRVDNELIYGQRRLVELAATGTDDMRSLDKHQNGLASCLALWSARTKTPISAGGLSPVDEVQSQILMNAGFSAEKPAFGSVCTSGGGPGLQNQSVRATRPSVTSDLARPSDTAPENDSSVLAQCLALLTPKYPDLALLTGRWEVIPEPIRVAIMALVKSSST